ncbi:hypothetical protein GCM10008179_06710 [Hansschlegelia plantiphila]|uniref:Uncharacterized protein n=1 Tax=Hansschlegelia plantiphila TaxID=374655 RepID=A0A9W6MUM0_9HYPH|nr:hypothetical protein GCM10008179_06710 [Hansschlegelia plantiphila]
MSSPRRTTPSLSPASNNPTALDRQDRGADPGGQSGSRRGGTGALWTAGIGPIKEANDKQTEILDRLSEKLALDKKP